MALSKFNFNSFDVTATASKGLAFNSSANGLTTVDDDSMVLIKEVSASSDATVQFVNGSSDVVFDSTYPVYKFEFTNCQPATDAQKFLVNFSTDAGSNFNVTKTSSNWYAGHTEADATGSGYDSGRQQSTSGSYLTVGTIGSAADESCSGYMYVFNPSSTTFIKHFMSVVTIYGSNPQSQVTYQGGYCNTTSAVDGVNFSFESGNVASGTIKMYGIRKS